MRRKTEISKILPEPDKQNYSALCHCPFCDEKSDSLVANSHTNRWECHACGGKGSVYMHVGRNTLILDSDIDVSKRYG